jgi:arylformamidase
VGELIDITVPIRDGMVHYDGNPEVHLERAQSIAAGDGANVSRLDFGVHSGTHIDAPLHFFDDGAAAETLPIEPLIGPAHVVDATSIQETLDEAAMRTLEIPDGAERVLFRTRNSKLWASDECTRDFVRLDGSGARYLIERGVRLVGIDYLSIGDHDAHVALLGAGIVALEGLDLGAVEPGPYRLICLPLKIVGSDGAPARALLSPTRAEHPARRPTWRGARGPSPRGRFRGSCRAARAWSSDGRGRGRGDRRRSRSRCT